MATAIRNTRQWRGCASWLGVMNFVAITALFIIARSTAEIASTKSWLRYSTEYLAAELPDGTDWIHTTKKHLYTMDISPTSIGELDVTASMETDEEVAKVLLQSYRQRAFRDGDVIIGVLLPIHRPASAKSYPVRCSIIWEEYGMHRMEQVIWTIEEINRKQDILPGVTLGYDIRDTCWTTQVALERTMDFIKSKAGDDQCSTASSSAHRSPLAAILGAASSEISVAVQEVAQMFDIPQVDFGSTSPQLSDKSMFRLFARVIPSDQLQATMLVDVIRHFGWQYVHGIYTEGNYGEKGYEAFRDVLGLYNVCLASTRKFLLRVPDNHEQYSQLITDLAKHPDTRVIVCFCDGLGVRALFRTLTKHNLNGSYVVVGSDGWNIRKDIIRGFESAANGGLSVTHWSPRVPDFEERFYAMTPHTVSHERNPWFAEYWAQKHGCIMSSSALLGLTASPFSRKNTRSVLSRMTTPTPFISQEESGGGAETNKNSTSPPQRMRFCTGNETTPVQDRLKQEAKLGFVGNSVYAVAHAIRSILLRQCWGKTIKNCEHLYPFVNGSMLFESLKTVSFINYAGEQVRFDSNMDGAGKYQLWNFQSVPGTSKPTLYRYMPIGEWENNQLDINDTIIIWPSNISSISDNGSPESFCSKACLYNQRKVVPNVALPCCWDCIPCPAGSYVSNGTQCISCKPGWAPNEQLTDCEKVKIRFRNLSEIESVVVVTVASVGILVAVCVWFAYYFTRRLSVPRAISLIGIVVTFCSVFSLLARPTLLTCYFSRILPPIAQSILFSPIFNRANAMVRIVNSSRKLIIDRRPRFISTNSQIALTCFIIGAQCTLVVLMLIWEAADVKIVYPRYNVALLVCRSTFAVITIPLAFNFCFMFATLVYAMRTRKIKQMIRSDESVYYPVIMGSNALLTFSSILFFYAVGSEDQLYSSAHQLVAGFSTVVMFILPLFSGPEQVDFDENTFADTVRNDLRQQAIANEDEPVQSMGGSVKKTPRRKSVSLRLWDTMTVMREVAASTKARMAQANEELASPTGTSHGARRRQRADDQRSGGMSSSGGEVCRSVSGEGLSKTDSGLSRKTTKRRFFNFSSSGQDPQSQTSSSGGNKSNKDDKRKDEKQKQRTRGRFVLITAPSESPSGSPNRDFSVTPDPSSARMSKRNSTNNDKSPTDEVNIDALNERLRISYEGDDLVGVDGAIRNRVPSMSRSGENESLASQTKLSAEGDDPKVGSKLASKSKSSISMSTSKESVGIRSAATTPRKESGSIGKPIGERSPSKSATSDAILSKHERLTVPGRSDNENNKQQAEVCRSFAVKSSHSPNQLSPSTNAKRAGSGPRGQPPLPPPPLPKRGLLSAPSSAEGDDPNRYTALRPSHLMEFSDASSAVAQSGVVASSFASDRSYDEVFGSPFVDSPSAGRVGFVESSSTDSVAHGGGLVRPYKASPVLPSAMKRRATSDQITHFSLNRAQVLHPNIEPIYGSIGREDREEFRRERPLPQPPQPQQQQSQKQQQSKRTLRTDDATVPKNKGIRL